MHVLVATSCSQGDQPDDFCFTVEGELVLAGPIEECCTPDSCGCGRAFPGLASCKSTTTAMVVERPGFDRTLLATAIEDSLRRQGWLAGLGRADVEQGLDDEIALIAEVTSAFPVGSILGRHDTRVWSRAFVAP